MTTHSYFLYCQIETVNTYKFQSTIDTIQADTIYKWKIKKKTCMLYVFDSN